jgi:hypothetical protein
MRRIGNPTTYFLPLPTFYYSPCWYSLSKDIRVISSDVAHGINRVITTISRADHHSSARHARQGKAGYISRECDTIIPVKPVLPDVVNRSGNGYDVNSGLYPVSRRIGVLDRVVQCIRVPVKRHRICRLGHQRI